MQGQLGLEGIPDRLVRVTPARLATWSACPRRYRMAYIDRPAPTRGGAWAHSTLGAAVHSALRALFELPPEKRSPERAELLVRGHWKNDGFAGPEQSADYRARAQRWVSAYVDRLDPDSVPVAVERWVSAPAGSIIAEGRVDRIDQRDGELVVVDYKTGRHAPTIEHARDSQALAMYALATSRTLHQRCRKVELHHLPSGQIAAWEHTEQSLTEHRRRAEELARGMTEAAGKFEGGADTDSVFPPVPGMHCSTCDFRQHCPEGKRAAPALDRWALLGQ